MPDALAPDSALPAAPLFAGAALLDAEELDAYRVALEFQALAVQLVVNLWLLHREFARKLPRTAPATAEPAAAT